MAFLEVQNFRKRFGDNEVLKGISFSLEKGEVLAIIGSSGGGKTTLLRCLNFLETPDEGTLSVGGEVLFDAAEQRAYTDAQIREKRLHFGLVFQQFNLFPQYTVYKNIALAQTLLAKRALRQKKEDLRAVCRIADKAERRRLKAESKDILTMLREEREQRIAARTEEDFLSEFLGKLAAEAGLEPVIPADNPGISAALRSNGETEFLFLFNYTAEEREVRLPAGNFTSLADGSVRSGVVTLPPFGSEILKK